MSVLGPPGAYDEIASFNREGFSLGYQDGAGRGLDHESGLVLDVAVGSDAFTWHQDLRAERDRLGIPLSLGL